MCGYKQQFGEGLSIALSIDKLSECIEKIQYPMDLRVVDLTDRKRRAASLHTGHSLVFSDPVARRAH